jgi:hypothetical protein
LVTNAASGAVLRDPETANAAWRRDDADVAQATIDWTHHDDATATADFACNDANERLTRRSA